jgi:hypothetical protein
MTIRNKYLTLFLSALASWLAMLFVGILAYLAGPALGFVALSFGLVALVGRVMLRDEAAE